MMRLASMVGMLLLASHGHALQLLQLRTPSRFSRGSHQVFMGDAATCAIDLDASEPMRVAQVLKKAWMEGGVKRGLVGTVLVREEERTVTLLCKGPDTRVRSFADWIEGSSMLVTGMRRVDTDEYPEVPLTSKFPLADAELYSGGVEGSFAGSLAEQIKALSVDIKSGKGKTHSSDEGKA